HWTTANHNPVPSGVGSGASTRGEPCPPPHSGQSASSHSTTGRAGVARSAAKKLMDDVSSFAPTIMRPALPFGRNIPVVPGRVNRRAFLTTETQRTQRRQETGRSSGPPTCSGQRRERLRGRLRLGRGVRARGGVREGLCSRLPRVLLLLLLLLLLLFLIL